MPVQGAQSGTEISGHPPLYGPGAERFRVRRPASQRTRTAETSRSPDEPRWLVVISCHGWVLRVTSKDAVEVLPKLTTACRSFDELPKLRWKNVGACGFESGGRSRRFEPLPPRGGAVSNELINRLREEDLD